MSESKHPPGQTVGYVRVSSADQNDGRQLEGLALDRRFTDHASGKDTKRPELSALLAYVRQGDSVFVHSMDRLARNLDDLRRVVGDLTRRGVIVRFVKENLTFTGEDSPLSHLLLSVLGAVAQFERELIHERQREGIALAKVRGAYKGRKPKLTKNELADLHQRFKQGESPSKLAKEFNVRRQTIYRWAAADSPAAMILGGGLKSETVN
jgi:DNA invertase Pin-like site-specific DNA recombinase